MSPLIHTIIDNIAALSHAIILSATAVAVRDTKRQLPRKRVARSARLDQRTQADIGIEPGSITWLR